MNDLPTKTPGGIFEQIKHIDEHGVEYWEARELMLILNYAQWRRFKEVIEKAIKSCEVSGQETLDHFASVGKVIEVGKGAKMEVEDLKLSRYACYLIAQNGDPRKKVIALAQTYFTLQTRKQELYESLPEDEKRNLIRNEVTDHNKKLFQTAQDSGVRNFGKFNDAGYMGLYGMTNKEIKEEKRIGTDAILDRAGATELAANLFRITQTKDILDKKLSKGLVAGEDQATEDHQIVGKKVRDSIKYIGGTMPEKLPPEEHITQVRKRLEAKKLKSPQKIEKLS